MSGHMQVVFFSVMLIASAVLIGAGLTIRGATQGRRAARSSPRGSRRDFFGDRSELKVAIPEGRSSASVRPQPLAAVPDPGPVAEPAVSEAA